MTHSEEVAYNEHEDQLVEEPWGVEVPHVLGTWSDLANPAGLLRIPQKGRSKASGIYLIT
jgi:hypothetical protein